MCDECGFIRYVNPLVVVGVVAAAPDGRVLLCKRAIAPRSGCWTIPGGFMECGESMDAGAAREAAEEANARVKVTSLLAVLSVPRISQVHVWHRGVLLPPQHHEGTSGTSQELADPDGWHNPGVESSDVSISCFVAACQ